LEVFRADVDTANRVFEPVLVGSQVSALFVYLLEGSVEYADSPVRTVRIGQ